jgi:hypothetical protein
LSEYEDARQKQLEHLRGLNPTAPDESLIKLGDDQFIFISSERFQFLSRFSDRFMTQFVSVALLSHALCEAAINAILAIGLVKHESQELFSLLEKAEIKEKWRVGPKSFFSPYEFNPGTALFETLNQLTKRRNALVHSKIHLQIGGETILKGSKFERFSVQENIQWMRRFFSLPYDLVAHASNQVGPRMLFFLDSAPIAMATAHKTTKGKLMT